MKKRAMDCVWREDDSGWIHAKVLIGGKPRWFAIPPAEDGEIETVMGERGDSGVIAKGIGWVAHTQFNALFSPSLRVVVARSRRRRRIVLRPCASRPELTLADGRVVVVEPTEECLRIVCDEIEGGATYADLDSRLARKRAPSHRSAPRRERGEFPIHERFLRESGSWAYAVRCASVRHDLNQAVHWLEDECGHRLSGASIKRFAKEVASLQKREGR